MLWIALHLPQLSLQALAASQPGFEAALPLAVAEPHRLLVANRAARALGVRAGQSLATALALAPALVVLQRNEAGEAAFVRTVALALAALTPRLQLCPSGVLMEVQASLRLFGGVRRLLRQAQGLARRVGAHPRLACAPSASGAWLLATAGRSQRHALKPGTCARRLDALPVTALQALLPLTPRQGELLEALGVQQLGALRALPRVGMQRRFGREMALALDRAYGQAPEVHTWFEPPERLALRRELMERADSAEVLVAAVEALLPALQGWLQLRWEAATVVLLTLRHERRREPLPDTVLRLELSVPSRDIRQMALLWRERLQRHALAAPVYELRLALDGTVPHAGTPGELLPQSGQSEADHAALLDRLVARLGPANVQRWWPVADHRPERGQQARPVHEADRQAGKTLDAEGGCVDPPQDEPASVRAQEGAQDGAQDPQESVDALADALSPPSRPAWLLPQPLPLGSDSMGRPLHGGRLRLCSRAERIEAGWFDGQGVQRDYHVAEGEDHRLRWIYRERRPGGGEGWFLHGWFA